MCIPMTNQIKPVVTTLQDSKNLNEYHKDYPTQYVWYIQGRDNETSISIRERDKCKAWGDVEVIPAFTADELLNIVHERIEMFDELYIPIRGNSQGRLIDIIIDEFESFLFKTTESGNLTK